jgi:hypothetical protein
MPKTSGPTARFYAATALWLLGMLAVGLAYFLLTGPAWRPPGGLWRVMEVVVKWAGLFVPFTAFAGGLRVHRMVGSGSVLAWAVLLAVLSYGLLAYAGPVVNYQVRDAAGLEVEGLFPFGPEVPGFLRALRAHVEANPPAKPGFSTDAPLALPPNWLTYRLHMPAAVAAFSVLSALLGWVAGYVTIMKPPAPRRNARWFLGVALGMVFMVTVVAAGDWVRRDPAHSGVLAAWGPLLVPGVCLAVLAAIVRRRLGHLRTAFKWDPP